MKQKTNATEISQQQDNHFLHDWIKLSDFLVQYPQFTNQQMRWLLLHRETNGLSEHTRKIGKPIYIHVPGFLQWIFEKKER